MADDVLLSFRMEATNGKPKVVPVWLPAASTLADALAYATAFTPVLEAVSDAYVQKASVEFALAVQGASKGAPDGNAYSHDGARILHDTAGRYSHGTWVPAWKPALLADDVVIVDLAVTALEAALRVGLGGIAPVNGHGLDLTAYLGGKRAYRK